MTWLDWVVLVLSVCIIMGVAGLYCWLYVF